MKTKKCSRCGLEKQIDDFYRDALSSDGHRSECKACTKLYQQSPAGNAAMRTYCESEGGQATRKAYEQTPKIRAYRQAYNKSKPGRASQKRQREKPERKVYARQYQRDWKKTPVGKIANRRNRKLHRARERGADGSWSQKEWDTMCKLSNYSCACCGRKRKLTVDHVVPLKGGGCNCIHNIQPLCLSCNGAKSNRHATDYRNDVTKKWLATLTAAPISGVVQ